MCIRTSVLVAITLGIAVALGATLYGAVDGSIGGLSPLHEPMATSSLY